jgi:hypothetical protein
MRDGLLLHTSSGKRRHWRGCWHCLHEHCCVNQAAVAIQIAAAAASTRCCFLAFGILTHNCQVASVVVVPVPGVDGI